MSQGVLQLETGPWNQGQGVLVLEHVLHLETIQYTYMAWLGLVELQVRTKSWGT